MADAMLIGERAQIDTHAIAVNMNPGRHWDYSDDVPCDHHEPSGFQSENEKWEFREFSLTVDGDIEPENRQERGADACSNKKPIAVQRREVQVTNWHGSGDCRGGQFVQQPFRDRKRD